VWAGILYHDPVQPVVEEWLVTSSTQTGRHTKHWERGGHLCHEGGLSRVGEEGTAQRTKLQEMTRGQITYSSFVYVGGPAERAETL
jgi:hypothetical protein